MVRTCPEKCEAQSAQPAVAIALGWAASEAPWTFAAAGSVPAPASAMTLGDSAVVVGLVASVPMVALTEGVVPPLWGCPQSWLPGRHGEQYCGRVLRSIGSSING